jgi:hypothetical protein
MTTGQPITLLPKEKVMWNEIKEYGSPLGGGKQMDEILASQAELTKLLLSRKAIPDIRIKYFTVPEFNTGNPKVSHQATFERNGTTGQQIFEHPHFRAYLQYFIGGPDLGEEIKQEASILYDRTPFEKDYQETFSKLILKHKKKLLLQMSKSILQKRFISYSLNMTRGSICQNTSVPKFCLGGSS